jgi:hypothetical protein
MAGLTEAGEFAVVAAVVVSAVATSVGGVGLPAALRGGQPSSSGSGKASGETSPLLSGGGGRAALSGRPRCIINRSASISQHEDELRRPYIARKLTSFSNWISPKLLI